jgi:hypothetical protein
MILNDFENELAFLKGSARYKKDSLYSNDRVFQSSSGVIGQD